MRSSRNLKKRRGALARIVASVEGKIKRKVAAGKSTGQKCTDYLWVRNECRKILEMNDEEFDALLTTEKSRGGLRNGRKVSPLTVAMKQETKLKTFSIEDVLRKPCPLPVKVGRLRTKLAHYNGEMSYFVVKAEEAREAFAENSTTAVFTYETIRTYQRCANLCLQATKALEKEIAVLCPIPGRSNATGSTRRKKRHRVVRDVGVQALVTVSETPAKRAMKHWILFKDAMQVTLDPDHQDYEFATSLLQYMNNLVVEPIVTPLLDSHH